MEATYSATKYVIEQEIDCEYVEVHDDVEYKVQRVRGQTGNR